MLNISHFNMVIYNGANFFGFTYIKRFIIYHGNKFETNLMNKRYPKENLKKM
jgi:hypothetical protein